MAGQWGKSREVRKAYTEDNGMDQTTTSSIEQRIHSFLLEKFPLARKIGIERDTALLEKGILDSLGILDVVSFLESEFSITISDEELVPDNFQGLNTLSSFVQKKHGRSA
jgi:acyl carrier protein